MHIFFGEHKFKMCRFMYTMCYKNEKRTKINDCTKQIALFLFIKTFKKTLLISFTFSDSLEHYENMQGYIRNADWLV